MDTIGVQPNSARALQLHDLVISAKKLSERGFAGDRRVDGPSRANCRTLHRRHVVVDRGALPRCSARRCSRRGTQISNPTTVSSASL